jgi:hypothetical protein
LHDRAALDALLWPTGDADAQGYEAREARAASPNEHWVGSEGSACGRDDAERLGDVVTFHWEAVAKDGKTFRVGLNFLVHAADGRMSATTRSSSLGGMGPDRRLLPPEDLFSRQREGGRPPRRFRDRRAGSWQARCPAVCDARPLSRGPRGELDFLTETTAAADPTSGPFVEDQLAFIESLDTDLLGALTYRMFAAGSRSAHPRSPAFPCLLGPGRFAG